jgi:aspartyl/glutamyl-tRNA(Asn/Gln) amidotransferase C subunit
MEFNEQTIDKLADLLMIGLTPEENKMVLDEFEIIDNNINKINKIEGIEKATPMTHALDDFECELREDVAEESPSIEELLANCDKKDGREVEVPKVVE